MWKMIGELFLFGVWFVSVVILGIVLMGVIKVIFYRITGKKYITEIEDNRKSVIGA